MKKAYEKKEKNKQNNGKKIMKKDKIEQRIVAHQEFKNSIQKRQILTLKFKKIKLKKIKKKN